MIIVVLAGFQIGYAMLCINRMTEFLTIKYDWPEEMQPLYIAVITGAAIVGLAFGSLASGVLMKRGRKRCMLIACAIGVTGCCIEMIDNFWVISFGRLIYGLACGISAPCIGRYIEEMLPAHLLSQLFPIYTCGMAFSAILVMMSAIVLPDIANELAVKKSEAAWRIFLGFPLLLYGITIAGIIFVIKHEPPKFLINNGREREALDAIHAIYHQDEKAGKIMQFIKRNSMKNTCNVSFKEAILSPEYRRATWTLLALNFFN